MRKILVSLLVVSMVLGLVGTAFAGYSDTSSHASKSYIDKASALNWMKGYPDGTFKPAGNITRAEFAAVIVRALGLEAAAASTAGLATKFKDVPGTHWAAGYINVAVNKGIAKGYPDGTFKPEANVTGAEVITMIVRALNREVDAVGEWPVGYISIAASENIINAGFQSSALATRADVATWVSKASDIVLKQLTTNGWVVPTDAASQKTFLKYNNLTKFRGVVETTDTSNKSITVSGTDAGSYTLDAAGVIAGGTALMDLKGYTVDLFKNNDTGKIMLVEPVTTVVSKSGTLRSIGKDYFYLNGDTAKYNVGYTAGGVQLNAVVIRNGVTLINRNAPDLVVDGKLATDDEITFFVGQDGNVNYIKAKAFDVKRVIVTDTYTAGTPYSITVKGSGMFFVATDAKITKNGVDVAFSDIKKDDIVSIAKDVNNQTTVNYIDATDKTVSGKVTGKRVDSKEDGNYYYMSIDGVEYRMESTCEIKDNAAFVTATAVQDKLRTGDVIKVYLSQRGRMRVVEITTGIADIGKLVSYITGTGSYDKMVVDMKGTQTTYEIAKPNDSSLYNSIRAQQDNGTAAMATVLSAGDYVKLYFDADGRATWTNGDATKQTKKIFAGAAVTLTDVYVSDRLVIAGGNTYLATDNTAVYVNGAAGSFAAIAKDQKAKIEFEVSGNVNKIVAIAVDTYAKLDTSAVAAVGNNIIVGGAGAAENNATVTFWTTANGAQNKVANDALNVDWLDWNAVTVKAGKANQASVTADAANTPTWGQNAGCFRVALKNGAVAVVPAPGTTVYIRVEDAFGNFTTAPITLR